jgi:hypothetical protein
VLTLAAVHPLTAGLYGFWFGGLVACGGLLALEWPGVAELPPVARVYPWRFAVTVAAMVLVWPAGVPLLFHLRAERKRQEAAERAEYERIEATREPRAAVAVGNCAACGAVVYSDDEQCQGCGAELDAEACPTCGASLFDD